ncbi:MAG: AAA family ATPase [Leptolyngbyaceae cyanobacterium SL_5_14]|nr:AAA family ATPase [Leptolyngbyaceae cyanobacterium SL_5_14]
MKIKRLRVNGFRSLVDFDITFDDDLTVIVGENDSGKTSLIDCLKIITQGHSVVLDDFTYGKDELSISVEIEDFIFCRTYKRNGENVKQISFNALPTEAFVTKVRQRLSDSELDTTNSEDENYIREIARRFGLSVRSNSNLDNLRKGIIERIESHAGELVIQNPTFPSFNNIQLDGRQFENISEFFKEVFVKEKQASIWKEHIDENITIEEFVKDRIQEYSNEISKQLEKPGILDKIRIFLRDLTEVKIELTHQPRNLNIDAKVVFLENGNEININNKGDGTKRRITMALLEFKKEKSLVPGDDKTVYLLDEPDTHLHVKAQIDLINTVESFALSGNQVILTTHSPFIVNSVKPNQVRLLSRNKSNTSINFLRENSSAITQLLRSLGVENTHLFFSRQIVLVEGETEENFIPSYYLTRTQRTISSGLIKVLNAQGIQNIPGFAKAILELHGLEKIYVVYDNDASTELLELIHRLGLPECQKFQVGHQEFEDAFDSPVLHRCWIEYHKECERNPPSDWCVDAIENLKNNCILNGGKFSKALRSLNRGGKGMTKPIFGQALGTYIESHELPVVLEELFTYLS